MILCSYTPVYRDTPGFAIAFSGAGHVFKGEAPKRGKLPQFPDKVCDLRRHQGMPPYAFAAPVCDPRRDEGIPPYVPWLPLKGKLREAVMRCCSVGFPPTSSVTALA